MFTGFPSDDILGPRGAPVPPRLYDIISYAYLGGVVGVRILCARIR